MSDTHPPDTDPGEEGVCEMVYSLLQSEGISYVKEHTIGVLISGDEERQSDESISESVEINTSDVDGVNEAQRELDIEDIIGFDKEKLHDPEQEVCLVEEGPERPPLWRGPSESDEKDAIYINLDSFEDEPREKIENEIPNSYEKNGRLLSKEQEKEYWIAVSGISDEKISEIITYFDDYLLDDQMRLLQRSLSLRKAWENDSFYMRKEVVDDLKESLDRRFEHGSTVFNLCSSSYYDRSEIFRQVIDDIEEDILDDIEDETEMNDHERQQRIDDLYRDLLEDPPFVVYAGEYGGKQWKLSRKVRRKIKQYDSFSYDVPFVDLRAQGYENRENAVDVLSSLQKDVSEMNFQGDIGDRESVYRVNPTSVNGLA